MKNVVEKTHQIEMNRLKRISIFYWMLGGNTVTKKEEEAEVLNAAFASVF